MVHAEDLPLHLQPAVRRCCCSCAARSTRRSWTRRPRSRCCTRRWAGPTRSPSGGCGRGCGRSRSPPATGGPPASCWSRRCATRPSWPCVERRWAAPAQTVAGAARHRPGGRRARPAPPPRTCCGRCGGPAAWPTGGRRSADRARRPAATGSGGPRRPTATWTPWWCSSTRRPGSSTGCPARGPRSSSTTCSARTCRPTRLAPSADRGEAVRLLTAHAAKGLEWDVVARRRRAGGRLAGPAPARQPARLGAAGRRARRPGGAPERAVVGPDRRRCWTRSGGCSTWPRPGPGAACWSPRSPPARVGGGRRGAAEPVPGRAGAGPTRRPVAAAIDRTTPPDVSHPDAARPDRTLGVGSARPPRPLTPARAGGRAARRGARSTATACAGRAGAAAAAELARLAAAGVPGARPGRVVGAARRCPTTGRWSTTASRSGHPVHDGERAAVQPALAAGTARRRGAGRRRAGRRQPGARRRDAGRGRQRRPGRSCWTYVADRFDAIELAARWLAGARAGPGRGDGRQAAALAGRQPAPAARDRAGVRRPAGDDPTRPIELERPGRPAGGRRAGPARRDRPQDRQVHRCRQRRRRWPSIRSSAPTRSAVEAGAFAELGDESGGAALVQLGTGARTPASRCSRRSAEADDPDWAYAMVRRTAETMAAATFAAVANSTCRVCPVRTELPGVRQGPAGGRAAERPESSRR